MQPFLELSKLWPYLPHFRVVAEYESLSRASRRFGLTSAALSKAIRTLERSLALQLFDRSGGTLRLNDSGRALLGVVRAAMREIDDGIAAARGQQLKSTLRIGSDAAWLPLITGPDEARIATSSIGEDVELVEPPSNVAHALLRGDVDVVLHADPVSHVELDTCALASLDRAVHVASTHPAASRRSVRADDVVFVAIRDARTLDGWPPHVSRRVSLATSSLGQALTAVTGGTLAAVAPLALGARLGLVPLQVVDLELDPLPVWITIRRSRRETSAAAAWRDGARKRWATAAR